MADAIKHPKVIVHLTGSGGINFAVLARVQKAMRKEKLPKPEVDAFFKEAQSGDFNHLIRTCTEWFTVD